MPRRRAWDDSTTRPQSVNGIISQTPKACFSVLMCELTGFLRETGCARGPVIHLQGDLRRVAVDSHDAGRHRRLCDSLGALRHGLGRQSVGQDVQQLTIRLRPAPTPVSQLQPMRARTERARCTCSTPAYPSAHCLRQTCMHHAHVLSRSLCRPHCVVSLAKTSLRFSSEEHTYSTKLARLCCLYCIVGKTNGKNQHVMLQYLRKHDQ